MDALRVRKLLRDDFLQWMDALSVRKLLCAGIANNDSVMTTCIGVDLNPVRMSTFSEFLCIVSPSSR